jgi:hypothetical protein
MPDVLFPRVRRKKKVEFSEVRGSKRPPLRTAKPLTTGCVAPVWCRNAATSHHLLHLCVSRGCDS